MEFAQEPSRKDLAKLGLEPDGVLRIVVLFQGPARLYQTAPDSPVGAIPGAERPISGCSGV